MRVDGTEKQAIIVLIIHRENLKHESFSLTLESVGGTFKCLF